MNRPNRSPALDNLIIRASAGTGKTFQLSNRFLALLRQGVPSESILATTFTRKAAGEILDRVIGRLAEAAGNDRKRRGIGPVHGRWRVEPRRLSGHAASDDALAAPAPRQHAGQLVCPDRPQFRARTGLPLRLADRRGSVRRPAPQPGDRCGADVRRRSQIADARPSADQRRSQPQHQSADPRHGQRNVQLVPGDLAGRLVQGAAVQAAGRRGTGRHA